MPAEIPEPTADIIEFAESLIVLYSDLAVQRVQCRSALIEHSDLTAAQARAQDKQ